MVIFFLNQSNEIDELHIKKAIKHQIRLMIISFCFCLLSIIMYIFSIVV